jgi:hypothetical protein
LGFETRGCRTGEGRCGFFQKRFAKEKKGLHLCSPKTADAVFGKKGESAMQEPEMKEGWREKSLKNFLQRRKKLLTFAVPKQRDGRKRKAEGEWNQIENLKDPGDRSDQDDHKSGTVTGKRESSLKKCHVA